MKNPERVAALIAELRTLTETDFERHRIDVLERDLTAPPTVEVIDDNHQRFDGVLYTKDSKGHYRSTFHIQRAVCIYASGKIPDGCHVHHVDNNPSNNTLKNLRVLTHSEHIKLHKGKGKPVAHRTWGQFLPCPTCGKVFQTSDSHRKYCSERCQIERNRHYEERNCVICGQKFSTRRDSKTKTCSPQCAATMRFGDYKEIRHCVVCGKEFEVHKCLPTKCCSRACASKLIWQTRKTNQ